MIRRRLNSINFVLRVITLLLPLLAFAIAAYFRFTSGIIPLRPGEAPGDINIADYLGLLIFTTLVWAVVVDHYEIFRLDHFLGSGTSTGAIFRACCVAYIAVMGASFFYRATSFSRLFVSLSAVILFLLAVASDKAFRLVLEYSRNGGSRMRMLVVGADEFAVHAAHSILERALTACEITAYVSLPNQEIAAKGGPVIELSDLRAVAAGANLDEVVIAIPTARFSEVPSIMEALEDTCVPVRAVLDLGKDVNVREMLFDFGGLRLLDLRGTPSESTVYLVAKRAFDLVVSSAVLVLLSPVIAAVAVAVRLTSAGPALFVQDRVGLSGHVFRMYKFRTMKTGDTAESDTRWTTMDDPRRTRFGSFLRRTNLDELPQFINVLKGEMSVVGPRPERPHFVQKFLGDVAQYNNRHYLKVGITGWAQVNGWRGDTSIARRLEHDLYYLRNWSLLFDMKIILLTVFRTFAANKNAY